MSKFDNGVRLDREIIKSCITQYREAMKSKRGNRGKTEGNLRVVFSNLLQNVMNKAFVNQISSDLELIEEKTIKVQKVSNGKDKTIRYDGVIYKAKFAMFGYWEAKDSNDDLDIEASNKYKLGYNFDNMLLENTNEVRLYQSGRFGVDKDVGQYGLVATVKDMHDEAETDAFIDLLVRFFEYRRFDYTSWNNWLNGFIADVPNMVDKVKDELEKQLKDEKGTFAQNFNNAKKALNEILTNGDSNNKNSVNDTELQDVLVQHILTGGILDKMYGKSDIGLNEIYLLIETLTSDLFKIIKRTELKRSLNEYLNTDNISIPGEEDVEERAKILLELFERFYIAYDKKLADRLGIVYTPNEISSFIVASVDKLLDTHFNKCIVDNDVNIIDPCTGTGNFVKAILRYVYTHKKDGRNVYTQKHLQNLYENNITVIEIELMSYYIANVLIEGTYYMLRKDHEKKQEIKNIKNDQIERKLLPHAVWADTLLLVGDSKGGIEQHLSGEAYRNTQLADEVISSKYNVILGNPPYNAQQSNESDNNRNKIYPDVDLRVKATYQKYSNAQKTKLQDPYIRFLRYASDKIDLNTGGIVAFITNRSYINKNSMDGVRWSFGQEFDYIYIMDLKGDLREGGVDQGGNVFNIMAGVSICFLIKERGSKNSRVDQQTEKPEQKAKIKYASLDNMTAKEKLNFLKKAQHILSNDIATTSINIDEKGNWLSKGDVEFNDFIPMYDKNNKKSDDEPKQIFIMNSNGVVTARDSWVFDFIKNRLISKMQFFIKKYNEKRIEFNNLDKNKQEYLKEDKNYNELSETFCGNEIKWERNLKKEMFRNKETSFDKDKIVRCLYRPFVSTYLYYEVDIDIINEIYQTDKIWGNYAEKENIAIGVMNNPQLCFSTLMFNTITGYDALGRGTYTFPLHYYDKDTRVDNITDWALTEFRTHYKDDKIEKEDIFYYVYAVLHRKDYVETYKENLLIELPRIPYYNKFREFAELGKKLADIHANYETAAEYNARLQQTKNGEIDEPRLKYDEETNEIILDKYNKLIDVPKACTQFMLGNRNVINWILKMYKNARFVKNTDIPEEVTKEFGKLGNINILEEQGYTELVTLLRKVMTVSIHHITLTTQLNTLM